MPKLLTIILNYRTAAMTLRAADAALHATHKLPSEIVIVDNDSQDGSYETIRDHATQAGWAENGRVRVIQAGRNGGYGSGNNIGIRAGMSDGSSPDFVHIQNSDAFPAVDAIERLMQYLVAHPDVGIAGSRIVQEDGTDQVGAFRFPSLISEFETSVRLGLVSRLFAKHRVAQPTPTQTQAVDWLSGASLMMRQSMLDDIGGFDENIFLYFEETDLCLRAARAGYGNVFVHDSVVTHIGSVSTGMKTWKATPDYWYDSRWYYFAKNHGRAYAGLASVLHITGGCLHFLRCILFGRKSTIPLRFLTTMARHDFAALLQRPKRLGAPMSDQQPGE